MFHYNLKKFSSVLLLSILMASANHLYAAEPVKSVDKSGNVTYSDKPVPGAESVSKVPIEEGPSSGEIKAAKKQAQDTVKAAKAIDASNQEKSSNQKAGTKATPGSSITEEAVINAGAQRKPLPVIPPNPKPPVDRPGINPPPTVRPRPRTGAN